MSHPFKYHIRSRIADEKLRTAIAEQREAELIAGVDGEALESQARRRMQIEYLQAKEGHITRCETEIALARQPQGETQKAYLPAMGEADWHAERRLIEKATK